MTDTKMLLQQIQHRQTMFTEEDESQLREIASTLGGFAVVRRDDLPPANVRGKKARSDRNPIPRQQENLIPILSQTQHQ